MLTKDEEKRHRVAKIVFNEKQILDFMGVRSHLTKRREISIYNREVSTLKELAEKYKVSSEAIRSLKLKEV